MLVKELLDTIQNVDYAVIYNEHGKRETTEQGIPLDLARTIYGDLIADKFFVSPKAYDEVHIQIRGA